MKVRALVFDFDGLICDTELPAFVSWRAAWREHGVELTLDTWSARIGTVDGFDPAGELEVRCGRTFTADAAARRIAHRNDLLSTTTPLPGVADYLADAARLGLAVGVASSSPREWVGEHLERLGLAHHFTCLSCFDEQDELAAKPAPDLYLAAVERLGVDPDDTIAFEDSEHGVTAAKAAGLHCVAVPHDLTRHMDFTRADAVVESLAAVSLEKLINDLGLG